MFGTPVGVACTGGLRHVLGALLGTEVVCYAISYRVWVYSIVATTRAGARTHGSRELYVGALRNSQQYRFIVSRLGAATVWTKTGVRILAWLLDCRSGFYQQMRVSAHVVSSLQWHVHASSDLCCWTACSVNRSSNRHLVLLLGWPDGSPFFSRSRPAGKSVMLAPCGGLGLPQPPLAVSPSQIVRCCALMSCQILFVSLAWSRHCAFAQAPVLLALHT